ncbi:MULTISPECIES: sn-glycerol-3-phosphate transporter [unclassified Pseudomonas]|uniref:sn-glycerol-3-phosphate transporter n=1 Tax=unclassified Pseudomonas TaxID=196821 RepID=UPI002AC9E9F2|nr:MULTISPECIES: sn-glycerol-3-phosphate transporter [unclassified Pseudomonas]MEB0040281.1 sn-glycerol-3-phosphate transporter [Pseudomonas sp. MH10]MEB0077431.1 sn-glycerol-3-phosphate transporter [Pseudomonas sp. MH10out]MEB0092788.1 sn-glycerol-3-phosphate transporter [Pseudomonas sp. CCI4.2]MEB0101114.1 sn-glycerol-3-phosphate transporter [Pseudomonas sp. CCI3.2]MEB0120610.1 sn-glycerol-3-phosphate transporter [Pseudomonas sp. CCI1.2]
MNVRKYKRWALAGVLAALAPIDASEATENNDDGFWLVQTSVYTRHFSPDPEHNNRQQLIGLERNEGSGLLYGAATFRNSYDQRSAYGYVGKRFESDDYPVYVKISGGLMYGYRGEYRDKIPFNRFGVAPVIIPSVGVHLGPVTAEAVLLGFSATMVNVGVRF